MTYFVLKYLHIVGAAVLMGTGAGIAFFMLMAHKSGDKNLIAGTVRIVVIADFVFTTTAVIIQPITGVLLAWQAGYSLWEGWIVISIFLYMLTGSFWLPVVGMQIKMRDYAMNAVSTDAELPAEYHRLFKWWFAFGFPAFGAVASIFWLMIARPHIPLWE